MFVIRAIIIAFSTFTRIPMPRVDYDERAQGLAIAFLPLTGFAVGFAVLFWWMFCDANYVSPVLFAAVVTVLPVVVTGGIHMDGFLDTVDALSAGCDRERALEILKDSRVGAFAVIRFCAYMLLYFGLVYELYRIGGGYKFIYIYPLSRCFAAYSAVRMPKAKISGMLAAFTGFTKKTDRFAVYVILALFAVDAVRGWFSGFISISSGFAGLALCVMVTVWYKRMAVRRFGGVTGDTTGYYLQIIELTLLVGLLLGKVADTAWMLRE